MLLSRFLARAAVAAVAGFAFAALAAAPAHADPVPPISCGDILYPGAPACRDYIGDDWNPGTAAADCGDIPGATGGTLAVGSNCDTGTIIGVCTVDGGGANESRLYFYSGDIGAIEGACSGALGGVWSANAIAGSCEHGIGFGPPGSPVEPVCRDYTGTGWDATAAADDCSALADGSFTEGSQCAPSTIGYCTIGAETADEYDLHFYTGDAGSLQGACESFLAGIWNAAEEEDDAVMPEALAALVSDSVVTVSPDSCVDAACIDTLIETNGAITFVPTGDAPTVGLVVYPGGNVDPRAYAVSARQIAAHGFLVAVLPFPGNLAITEPMRANYVLFAHPEIEHWAIGGHSLGGVTASIYADVNPLGKIEGIALWAALLPDTVDLSDNPLKSLTVYATNDAGLPRDQYEAMFDRLAAGTLFVDIRGGNHAQFGYYGEHEGDLPASISRAYQHSLFAGATVHMLNRLGVCDDLDVIDRSYAQLRHRTNKICRRAQRRIAGFRRRDLRGNQIENTTYTDPADFGAFRPSFPQGDKLISVATYPGQVANPTDITAPPVYDGEIWCKMKSQAAIAAEYELEPVRDEGTCAMMNETVYAWVLEQIDFITYLKLWLAGIAVELLDDADATSGPEYLNTPVSLTAAANPDTYALRAVRLLVPTFVPPPYGGAYYCKVWSPMGALAFINRALINAGW